MADVVVVGAGLAGLRCADALVRSGAEVAVLEARDRVGGRVWSHHFADGQVCERGAEFIDGNHSEVLTLAGDLGLPLRRRSNELDAAATLIDAGGRPSPLRLHSSLVADRQRWEAALTALVPGDELEGSTLDDLIASLELSAMGRLVIGREVRTEFMLPPAEVSQRFAAEVVSRQVPSEREVFRVIGGNDRLAHGLAARLGRRVRLGVPVRRIDADTGAVTTATGEVIGATSVVAAGPLPVLSRLWPEMPAELATVAYGVGGKISIQFRRRLWLDYGRNGTVVSDRQWGQLWETTDDQPGDAGVLTNLLASHDGAAFVALPEAPATVIREVDRLFPGAQGLAGERVHTDWTNDPYSLGCYVCAGPGQWAAAQPHLHRAHGRLWLAGEHADGFTGFMEGALRSGARVAERIAAG